MKDTRVTLPSWMDNYRSLIRWTEGHPIEAILNDEIPAFAAWRKKAVLAQVELLDDLKRRDMLVAYFHNGYKSGEHKYDFS